MAGMGDGYVGTAQDAARIRRLEKQREVDRKKIEELKNKSSGGQTGLLQFGSGTSEVPLNIIIMCYKFCSPITTCQCQWIQYLFNHKHVCILFQRKISLLIQK